MNLVLRLNFIVCLLFLTIRISANNENIMKVEAKSHIMSNIDNKQNIESDEKVIISAPKIPIGEYTLKQIKNSVDYELNDVKTVSETLPDKSIDTPQKKYISSVKSCNLNYSSRYAPSDISAAVGKQNIVVVTNVDIGVYNKNNCKRIKYESLKSFFSSVGTNGEILFDPRVIYDFKNNRFFVTAESYNSNQYSKIQYQYFAISKNSLGTSWWMYKLRLSDTSHRYCKRAINNFWDYPSAGYDKNRWYITANDFGSDVKGAILSIDKIATLSGKVAKVYCFPSLIYNIQPPIVMDNAQHAYFLSPGSGYGNKIIRYKLTPYKGDVWRDTLSKANYININSWYAAPNAPQPNGEKLDTLDGRFQAPSIQKGNYLWNVHTIKTNNLAGIRFYKLSTSTTAPLLQLTMTTIGDNPNIFNPSVAINNKGEAFINTSRTTSNSKVSMIMLKGSASKFKNWSFRTIATSTTQYENCNSNSRGYCRWGDYSATQLDPTDINNAWGFNQLVNGNSQFKWITKGGKIVNKSNNLSFIPSILFMLQ